MSNSLIPAKNNIRRRKRLPPRRSMPRSQNGSVGYRTSAANWQVSSRNFTARQTSVQPFPFRYNAKLTYGVNVTMSTSSASPLAVKYRFSLNSGYDPDRTATGNQPYQWDQLIAIYQYYMVHAAFVDVTFTDPTIDGLWVGWSLHPSMNTNDDPAGKDLGQLMERANYVCMPLNNTGAQTATYKMRIPIHEVFGISKSQYLNQMDTYGAFYNTNPTNEAFLDLFLIDPTGNVSAHSVRAVGRIVFDIQFWGYAAPSSS